ncbi:MAG: hypothetical protein EPO26_11370 [Chloroflexota bacterium]|nr:MAG: hypothetical protein EPO26_11370 [Chloroflexota bacterium]
MKRLLASLDRDATRWIVAILLLGFALRVAIVLAFPHTIIDSGNREKNDEFAQVFLASGTFGTAPREPSSYTRPAYAWFLIALYSMLGRSTYAIGLTQAALSAFNVLLAFLVAYRLVGRRAAIVAAAMMAIYPYPVWHDVHVVRTGLDTFLVLASVLFLLELAESYRVRYAIAAGITMFGASQTTNLLLAFVPFACLWLLFRWRSLLPTLRASVVLALAGGIALAPWVVRNYALHGRFVPSTTDNGIAFYKNNNPFILDLVKENKGPDYVMERLAPTFVDASRLGLAGDDCRRAAKLPLDQRPPECRDVVDEAEAEAIYFARGMQWIRENPGQKIELAARLALNLWDPTGLRPRSDTFFEGNESIHTIKNLAYALSFGPILLLGAIGLAGAARKSRDAWLVIGLFAFITALYASTYATTRYRIPFDGLLAAYAAATLLAIVERVSMRSTAEPTRS